MGINALQKHTPHRAMHTVWASFQEPPSSTSVYSHQGSTVRVCCPLAHWSSFPPSWSNGCQVFIFLSAAWMPGRVPVWLSDCWLEGLGPSLKGWLGVCWKPLAGTWVACRVVGEAVSSVPSRSWWRWYGELGCPTSSSGI